MWHSWEGILRDRFRVRRGRLGRGIYGALDLDRFGVRDIVGRKLDGTSGKGCEKGLGEREFGHGESKRGVLRYGYQLKIARTFTCTCTKHVSVIILSVVR